MTRIAAALCALLAMAALTGCDSLVQTWDSTWTSSKAYYKDYINPDPQVNLEDLDFDSTEEKLALLFTPVDKPVYDLSVYLNRLDSFPTEEWTVELKQRFPWINGLAVATMDGEIVATAPEVTVKPRNLAPLVAYGEELSDRRLRCFVDQTPLGPEVYLGTAMFNGNKLVGIIVVHFDPRSVVNFSPAPQELMVISPQGMLWDGGDAALGQALAERPWDEILAEQSAGRLDENGVEYAWQTRYVGNAQIVYLTETAPDSEGGDDSFLWFF